MRVVQLSDSHLSAATGMPDSVQSLLDWIKADPPDLVVHTGDIVWFDPDDTLDRSFARLVLSTLPCPLLAVPGNHDVGFFEGEHLPARLHAFRAAWGDDRFVHDADGWRLIGIDIYTVGHEDADRWLASALDVERPIALFVHQPRAGGPTGGGQPPAAAVEARTTCGLRRRAWSVQSRTTAAIPRRARWSTGSNPMAAGHTASS